MSTTIYCTYLTVYHGDKLPPLYIGSTSVEKINQGYHGSVSSIKYRDIWKSELLENPDLFETQILTTHNTREEAFDQEVLLHEQFDVVYSDLYINMAIAKGKLFNIGHSEETKNLMSDLAKNRWKSEEYRKRNTESNTGLKRSEEVKIKMKLSSKKRWENEEQRKKVSEFHKGKIESEETRNKKSKSHTGKPLSEEHRRKISEGNKRRYESQEERMKSSEAQKKRRKEEKNNQ